MEEAGPLEALGEILRQGAAGGTFVPGGRAGRREIPDEPVDLPVWQQRPQSAGGCDARDEVAGHLPGPGGRAGRREIPDEPVDLPVWQQCPQSAGGCDARDEVAGHLPGPGGREGRREIPDEPVDLPVWQQRRCDALNEAPGHLPGPACPYCHNKGYVVFLDGGEEVSRECRCMPSRRAKRRIERSGLDSLLDVYTFDRYTVGQDWQKRVRDSARDFLNDRSGQWWYIGGQAGAGKTHICTAITGALLKRGLDARYMLWRDEAAALKACVNDGVLYRRLITPLKQAPVLYIDDFWKTGSGEDGRKRPPTAGDINLAFEILNSRYNRPEQITLLSGEWTTDELIGIDPAIGSRIYQRAKHYHFDIGRAADRNYRLKP